jgi:hypothetical protein
MNSPRTTETAADDEPAGATTQNPEATTGAGEPAEAPSPVETGSVETGSVETDSDDDTPAGPVTTTDEAEDGAGATAGATRREPSGLAAGATAVVAAGLGLASLTGTWLSDLMASRQELIGQINGQTATPEEQVATIYGTPWHTTALFNGFFALAAILLAGVALAIPTITKDGRGSPTWVRAVAVGGLALGALGLLIAGAMWFDVFTDLPAVPEAPQP